MYPLSCATVKPKSIPDEAARRRLFKRRLVAWFRRHGRDLPWRRTREPYPILVSEVMLQQTQVARVSEYWPRFLDRFQRAIAEGDGAAHAACFTMALSFALAKEGLSDGTLETTARVKLDKDGEGFKVSRSDLQLAATVPGIDEARFREIAEGAKAGCPISKLLNAEIGLEISLAAS